jgi:hypothetical protein
MESGSMFEHRTVTVRRHSEAAEENASEAPGIDYNAADQAAVLGVAGSPIKPLFRISKMPDPTGHSSAPSSTVLILDLCSSLHSWTRSTGDASNSCPSLWSQDNRSLERARRSAGQRPRIAVAVHPRVARTKVEVARHRRMFPLSFQA